MVRILTLAFVFLLIPVSEIIAFVVIGDAIGVFWTLSVIFFTAFFGVYLLRRQGFSILQKTRSEFAADKIPGNELIHGAMILFAGLLLFIPGFITDTIGLLFFIPGVREFIWGIFTRRINWSSVQFERRARSKSGGGVVDLEEEEWEIKTESSASSNADSSDDLPHMEIEQRSN